MVDELGRIVDGDQLLYIIARARAKSQALRGPVVGTVMSNLGLEVGLRELGIEFRRAPVGDRYVLGLLRETGGMLGGETSGHLLCLDKTTTGDGLIGALAGARHHEADRPEPGRTGSGNAALSAGAAQRQGQEPL